MDFFDEIKKDWDLFFDKYRENLLALSLKAPEKASEVRWKQEYLGYELIAYTIYNGGITNLSIKYNYLINMYCFAIAAEKVAESNSLDRKDLESFWRVSIRNYHILNFIPTYFSYLDNSAYLVASLLDWEIIKEDKKTQYNSFLKKFKDTLGDTNTIGFLSQKDRKLLFCFLVKMDIERHDPELNKFARDYRNDFMHHFFPGIDNDDIAWEPVFKKDTFTRASLQLRYESKYAFSEVINFGNVIIPKIDGAFLLLLETDLIQSLLDSSGTIRKSSTLTWEIS